MHEELDFYTDFGDEKKESKPAKKTETSEEFDMFSDMDFDLEKELGQFEDLSEKKKEEKRKSNERLMLMEKDLKEKRKITNPLHYKAKSLGSGLLPLLESNESMEELTDQLLITNEMLQSLDFESIETDDGSEEDRNDSKENGELKILRSSEEINQNNQNIPKKFLIDSNFLDSLDKIGSETEKEAKSKKTIPRLSNMDSIVNNIETESPLTERDIEELNKLKKELNNPQFFKAISKKNSIDPLEIEKEDLPTKNNNKKETENFKSQKDFPLFKAPKYYEVEDSTKDRLTRVMLTHEEFYTPYYKFNYHNKPHSIYRGLDKNQKPIFIAVEEKPTKHDFIPQQIIKAMIFSSKPIDDQSNWALIPADCKSIKEALINILPPLAEFNLQRVRDDLNIKADLLDYENKILANSSKYKFGILYIKKDQVKDEDKMYSNGSFFFLFALYNEFFFFFFFFFNFFLFYFIFQ